MSSSTAAADKKDNNTGDGDDSQQQQELPFGWTRSYSNSQKRYYYVHEASKHSQWHFPTASEVADPTKAKRRAQMNQKRQQQNQQKRPAQQQQQDSLGDIVGDNVAIRDDIGTPSAPKRARTTTTTNDGDDDELPSIAIIVPFRDLHEQQHRAAHLQRFIPHMNKFCGKLVKKGLLSNYHVYIIEQSNDGRKFNRGKLLNIGFEYARKAFQKTTMKKKHDVFIFHDVDLLPMDDLGEWYSKFPTVPIHIARVWGRYSNNPKYFGGVVSFSESDYKRINGYPNTFWGWGGEDDEMQKRLEKVAIKWTWPSKNRAGTLVDLEDMTLKEKLDFLRQNKKWKCMVKWEALDEHDATWKQNGLADLKYKVIKTVPLDNNGGTSATKVTVDVMLNGNHWANDKCGLDYMP